MLIEVMIGIIAEIREEPELRIGIGRAILGSVGCVGLWIVLVVPRLYGMISFRWRKMVW